MEELENQDLQQVAYDETQDIESTNSQTEKNPYDISQDMGLLQELQSELQQTISSIDSDFASFYATNMPSEVEELFYEDRAKFLLEVEKAKQGYLEQRMIPMQQKASELQQTINDKQNQSSIWEAQIAFTRKYPDVDLDEMLAFYNEELSPKQKKELEKLGSLEAMYEQVVILMRGNPSQDTQQDSTNTQTQQQRNFPIDTSDAQFANRSQMDEDIARDTDLPINRR